MSLLMDALKKAEEAKRLSEAASKAGLEPQGPEAQPGSDARASGSQKGLPELPDRLELLDDEFHAAAGAPKPPAADAQTGERAAVQNVFASKRPVEKRAFPFYVLAFTLVACMGIGIYFWWQLRPAVGPGPAQSAARSAGMPIAASPAPPAVVAPSAPLAPLSAMAAQKAPAPETAPFRPAPEPANPIRLTSRRLTIPAGIERGYQAFNAGDLNAARQEYEAVIRGEPKNTDALNGLASISLREGNSEAAEEYFLRVLEADPMDASAQAGLIGLRGPADPIQTESRLKFLLANQPDSSSLHFTLGNLYARQGRWNEAQQAYFSAYAADSENPDYLFNLAISLEQVRQPKLALQYYQSALAASASRPAAFDKKMAGDRVRDLQR